MSVRGLRAVVASLFPLLIVLLLISPAAGSAVESRSASQRLAAPGARAWVGVRLAPLELYAGWSVQAASSRDDGGEEPSDSTGGGEDPSTTNTLGDRLFAGQDHLGPFERLGRDALRAGELMLSDMGHIYTTPLRMDWSDAAWLGLAVAGGYGIYTADREIYDAFQDWKDDDWYQPIRWTGELFEPMGTKAFTESIYISGLLIGYVTGWELLRDINADMLEAIYLSLPMQGLTKFGTGRARPYEGGRTDWRTGHGAFISGHTANLFQLAGVLAHHLPFGRFGAYTVASAVALERITSTDHWPSDVYAGALWGWFVTKEMFKLKAARTVRVQPMITADGEGVGLTLAVRL